MKKNWFGRALGLLMLTLCFCFLTAETGCDGPHTTSETGINKASANVKTQADGLTVEQNNVKRRLEMENAPGKIMFLYGSSPYTGKLLFQSVVKGKITSSGKRLTPYTVISDPHNEPTTFAGFDIDFNGHSRHTSEVLQDDGTYGSSIDYLFWWDTKGVYHQIFPQGVFLTVSDQPLQINEGVVLFQSTKESD